MPPAPLTRREALRAAGSSALVALSGCPTRADPAPTVSPAPVPTGTSTRPTGPPSSSPTPPPAPVDPGEVSFDGAVRRQFTAAHPARIRLALTYHGETTAAVMPAPYLDFSSRAGRQRDGDAELLLLEDFDGTIIADPGEHVPATPVDGCWRVRETDLPHVEFVPAPIELRPGKPLTVEFDVYGWANDECLPAGIYDFDHQVGVWPSTNAVHERYDSARCFALAVEDSRAVSIGVPGPTAC